MNLHKSQLIVLLAVLFLPAVSFSQFTYLDISLGNKFMKMSEGKSYRANKYNQTNLQLNGLWRFRRHFGVGASASIPIRHGGKFNLSTSNGSYINKYSQGSSSVTYDYFYKESARFAINGRIYGGIKANFYFDGRISFFTYREYLTYIKPAPGKTLEENSFKQIAPGFSVGMQPHLGRNLYLNFNLSWDFYSFKNVGFKNGLVDNPDTYPVVEYSNVIYFKSEMPAKTTAFSFNFGLGYFF